MRQRATRARRVLACGLAAWSALLAGCGSAREARWLELERAGPELLEPGASLRVEGSGFAAGQGCSVRFDGTLYRPGLPPLEVHASLPARAVSASEVVVPLSSDAIASLGGHGSFAGELTVSFDVREGAGRVTGTLPVRLDLSAPLARGAAHEQRLREQARRLLEYAGLVPAEGEPVQSGLVLAYAREGSPGAALGLRQGDAIVRAAGVSVHAFSDLAPPPSARTLELVVRPSGTRAERRVALPLLGLHAPDLSEELGRLSALCAWVLCCVVLLWPGAAFARTVVRLWLRYRHAPAPRLGLWGGTRVGKPRGSFGQRALRAALSAFWPALASAAGVLLVWLEPAGFLQVRSLSIYLGLCAISVMLTLLSDAGSSSERLRAALGVAGRMLVMGVLIACACALTGTRAWGGMVMDQGAWPARWAVFQKPALLVAFPLYVVFASRLGATTLPLEARGRAAQLLVAERVLTNVVLCALGVAIFAGGWQCPEPLSIDGVEPRALGAALYVLKAWGFAWLLSLSRRSGFGDGLRLPGVAAACLAVVALTALWLWLSPSAAVELALGRALFASGLLLSIAAAIVAAGLGAPRSAPDPGTPRPPGPTHAGAQGTAQAS